MKSRKKGVEKKKIVGDYCLLEASRGGGDLVLNVASLRKFESKALKLKPRRLKPSAVTSFGFPATYTSKLKREIEFLGRSTRNDGYSIGEYDQNVIPLTAKLERLNLTKLGCNLQEYNELGKGYQFVGRNHGGDYINEIDHRDQSIGLDLPRDGGDDIEYKQRGTELLSKAITDGFHSEMFGNSSTEQVSLMSPVVSTPDNAGAVFTVGCEKISGNDAVVVDGCHENENIDYLPSFPAPRMCLLDAECARNGTITVLKSAIQTLAVDSPPTSPTSTDTVRDDGGTCSTARKLRKSTSCPNKHELRSAGSNLVNSLLRTVAMKEAVHSLSDAAFKV